MEKNKNLRPIILIFGIITFFIFVISFTTFYTTENFSSTCGCKLPIWVIIVSVSSLGLFVGLITYYFISKSFIKERKEKEKNILKILDFFDKDEKDVLFLMIKNKGKINQNNISKTLNFNKVKVSRIVSDLEKKNLLKKEKNGMTNNLILNEELKNLFLD
jgi:uncharacterized membrane protein